MARKKAVLKSGSLPSPERKDVEPFVAEGLGLWPHPVCANQMAMLGPPGDPAGVRRIAASKSPYVSNSGVPVTERNAASPRTG